MTTSHAFVIGLIAGVIVACSPVPPPLLVLPDGGIGAGGVGGGSSGTGGGSADGGLPLRSACATLNARRCETLRTCGVIDDTTDAYRACVAWLTATWCGPTQWPSRVEVGTLRYDAIRAQTCATDWATRSCSDWAMEPASCKSFLLPAVSLGGRCYDGYQECSDGVCRGGGCPRKCLARGAIAEVCLTTADCQANLYCRPPLGASGSSQCSQFGAESAPCGPTQLCAPGLVCSAGACRRLPVAEQPCVVGRCDDSAFCVASADGGVCESRRDAGLGCNDDSQCGPSLVCDAITQSCVASSAPIGAECSPRQQCPQGATCLIETGQQRGVCSVLKRATEPCRVASDCQGHLTCVEADGGRSCAPLLKNASVCSTSRDCLALSACVAGNCVGLPALGEPCSTTRPCLWGACLDGADGGAVCIEPQGPGQACRTGADCASGRCEQGLCAAACLP
ncbi:MAG: Dickkopf N-terminal cysteine-rich domain-containing protein [Myxococcales bacterium]|nr:Dickkopf N-terminal cysteine-rich domain-containing protein [Myxococcales bacterium]